jgi:lipopolysaccharide/colanic/teichoic acid biosynthesis glycosyltransferase
MYKAFKRVSDVVVAGFLIAIFSPLLGVLWLSIVLSLGRPGVLVQWRPGFRGNPFGLFKFRTMTGERDSNGQLLPDECRLTRLGGFLRRTSLDELPELFNVLKGEMSLVGPRPLLVEYLPLYDQRQSRRHEVRPGVTGLAQISGRNAITWERKFDLDVYYVDHMSFWLDMRILLLTVWKVLKSEGISAEGHATMPPFRGSHFL